MMIQTLAVNKVGNYRKATLNDKAHYVVPMAMISPGVLSGSKGALYYPPEEIRKNYDAWNGMPLVVTHPTVNGKPVSARSPSQLEKSVGVVLNAKINQRGKLMAEAWFDVEKTKSIDDRIISRIERGEQIELSTGLFTDNIPVSNEEESVYNGKKYTHVAKNYRPDHLAILPDETGACSLKDGCGVGVLNKADKSTGLLINVLSYTELYVPLEQAIKKQFDGAYINEIYSDFVIFRWMDTLYKIGYKVTKDDEVNLLTEVPEKVRRVVSYKPAVTVNQLSRLIIDAFINNKSSCDGCILKGGCSCKKKKLRKITGVKYYGASGPVDYKTEIEVNSGRCWKGYKPVKGKKAYSKDSCEPVGNIESAIQIILNKSKSSSLDMTAKKACKILKDGTVHGSPLSKKQKGLFGVKCGERKKPTRNSDPLHDVSDLTKAQYIINVFSDEARAAALEARRHGGKALKSAGKAVGLGIKSAGKRVGKAYKEAALSLIAKIKARLGMKSKPKKSEQPSKRQQNLAQQEKTRKQRVEQRQKQLQDRLAKARQDRAAKDAKKKSAVEKSQSSKSKSKSKPNPVRKGASNEPTVKQPKSNRTKAASKKLAAQKSKTSALKDRLAKEKDSLAKSKEKLGLARKINKVNKATRRKEKAWGLE